MNLVSRLLPLNHVLLGLEAGSKKRLLGQIGLLFENSRQIPRSRVFDALFDRENLGSTGLGYGVAIPHGLIRTPKQTGRASGGPAQEKPSRAPEAHASEAPLGLLSELAQMFSDAQLRAALAATHDIQAAHRLITEWSPYAPAQ